jgi:hypothetical protein
MVCLTVSLALRRFNAAMAQAQNRPWLVAIISQRLLPFTGSGFWNGVIFSLR